ncbi:response regulator [Niveibacterium terrae]|uniref:response regulator n=1 Tax=Niveibacterium terrae TaxID=3373598 RepID=UPI003A94E9F0
MNRLMMVDDEENVLRALRRVLERAPELAPLEFECFTDPRAAMARLTEAPFDVVMSDFRMPDADGVSVLSHALAEQPDCVRLILSAQADMGALVRAINDARIHRFLPKPWDEDTLIGALAEAFRHHAEQIEERRFADAQRLQSGVISAEEEARRELERQTPGITRVKWGPNGEVLLDDDPD